jgi:hypothetical protein
MLGSEPAVLKAPISDGLSLAPFALFDDGWRPAEVGVGGCHVVQALMVALVVVGLDERLDPSLKIAEARVVSPARRRLPPSINSFRHLLWKPRPLWWWW